MKRFQRQILLPEVGEAGQQALAKSKVLVIGAGGLGHPVIQYLVGMGVGTVGVVDGDVVSESNLHRQILFDVHDLGQNKANVVKNKIQKRAELTEIYAYPMFLNKALAKEVFPQYDLVVDGTDNFEAKFLINDLCCALKMPCVYGSISQFEGQVSVFWGPQGPCYRCLVKSPPISKIQSCAEAGVIGALPGIIGSIQALEVLKVLIKKSQPKSKFQPLLGRLQVFDFLDNTVHTLKLSKRKDCLCQNQNLTIEDIPEILAPVCLGLTTDRLLDVREQEEWNGFHRKNCFHWPLSKIEKGELPDGMDLEGCTTICKSGARAKRAAEKLKDLGIKRVGYTQESIYGY